MAAADRNLEEEFDAATDEVRTRGRRVRAAVERVTDRAGEVWDDATNEASRRGREGAAALERRIEERPFISVLMAFGVGVLIGRLINR
jgi:ElaB/YqjD/DUF883 family membrane-anchored ribosome-binding protein